MEKKKSEWKVVCLWDSIGQSPTISQLQNLCEKFKEPICSPVKTAFKNKLNRSVWSEVGNSYKKRNCQVLKIIKKAKTVKAKKSGWKHYSK